MRRMSLNCRDQSIQFERALAYSVSHTRSNQAGDFLMDV